MRTVGVLAALVLALAAPSLAQSPEISDEQLELLEQLTPEQREALLDEFLGDREDGGRVDARTRDRDAAGGRAPEDVRRLSRADGDGTEGEGLEPGDESEAPVAASAMRREPRIQPGAQLLVEIEEVQLAEGAPPIQLEVRETREELRDRIRRGNPYRLDSAGRVELPGFEPLPLLGLTERLASKRLATDPDLADFRVRVTLLPLEKSEQDALKPYGYDLFTDAPSTFAADARAPVPSGYIIGAGDVLRIQLFGNVNRSLTLEVGRDGQVDFPQIGPIAVEGLSFAEAKEQIEARVADQMIGVRANAEMGETRAIRVFLLGEVIRPGSYTVSALATVTHALFAGGGIDRAGSLRNVQLKRGGRLVRRLDLYDLLLRGDTSSDVGLLAGDVVFIPPVGTTATVSGEIRRPAIYELNGDTKIGELVTTAGGLTPLSDPRAVRLERINERGERVVLDLDLTDLSAGALPVRTGDRLHIMPVRDTVENAIVIEGHVLRPGPRGHRPGLRVSDVLGFADLRAKADTHYVLVRRELPPDHRIEALSIDLAEAIRRPGSSEDLLLQPRDRLTVFDLQSGRDRVVSSLLRDLRGQATLPEPMRIVTVAGRVRAPGQYPLEHGMRVSDLIRAGGSLEDAAYGGDAELTRRQVVGGEMRRAELIPIDLASVLSGDSEADLALEPYDTLTIKQLPEWRETEFVTLSGEVRFPGTYPLRRGEALRSVVERAGGLTDLAFPEGAVLLRQDLLEREQRELDRLEHRLRRDLAILAVQGGPLGTQSPQVLALGEDLVAQLQSAKATGRLVIDLPGVVRGEIGGSADVVLKAGDRILVPKQSQEVTVIGEVQNPTSHRFLPRLSRNGYIEQSGGFTTKADKRRAYVVRANGSVVSRGGGAWFELGGAEVRPGDTIVVPVNAERMRPIALWTAATQILYNLAIAAAAVNSF